MGKDSGAMIASASPLRHHLRPSANRKKTESRRPSLDGDPSIPCVANLFGQQFIHLGHGQRLEPETSFLDCARNW